MEKKTTRVCAINSSLRGKRGATYRLLEQIGAGVKQAGGDWDVVNLAELHIEGCRACNHCQKSKTYQCIFDERDETTKVFERMTQADLLIYASPVYVFGISSLFKRLIERIYSRAPIEGAYFTQSGLFFHATDRSLTGKPFVSLVVCDNMENLTVRNTKEFFRIFSRFMDTPQVGHLERRSAAAWAVALKSDDAQARVRAESVLTAYVRAGEELISAGRISKATKRAAEIPFVHIPLLVRLARHFPPFRTKIAAEMEKRSGVMVEID